MDQYSFTVQGDTVQITGFEDTLSVYGIERWETDKAYYYQCLLAHQRDMDYAKAYLEQMFFNEDTTLIDGALINSAIQLLVRCFSNPSGKGRRCLNSKKVFREYAKKIGEEDLTSYFAVFYDARNKVISHDETDFRENILGLIVDNESGCAKDLIEITIRTRFLYKQNQKILLRMIAVVSSYIEDQLKGLKKLIVDSYNQSPEKPDFSPVKCKEIILSNSW